MGDVPPTRMNLGVFKGKNVAAKKGYDLLKSKADALKVRFRDICKVIYDTKVGMADQSGEAFFSLTQAEYAAGNFRNKVLENNMTASIRVNSRTDNVAGVKLPVFTQQVSGVDNNENIGLAAGGRKVTQCREKFGEYLTALIKIASLQTSFLAMDEALKVTNRRVNALENVTIPKIVTTIDYINRELDELEREDFTRLKLVKKKKEEQIKLDDKEKLEKQREAEEASLETKEGEPIKGIFGDFENLVSRTGTLYAIHYTPYTIHYTLYTHTLIQSYTHTLYTHTLIHLYNYTPCRICTILLIGTVYFYSDLPPISTGLIIRMS